MTLSPESVLSVVLTQGEGDGEGFLNDVSCMLERIAKRVGATLDTVDRRSTSCTLRPSADAPQLAELAREVGVHRAQLVPAGSTTGRVVTAKVIVSLVPNPGFPTDETILRTYDYPMRRVTVHSTGEIADLDDVLAGLIWRTARP
jgi:protein subunit release factor A